MQIVLDVQDEFEAAALIAIVAERRRQDQKFGEQNHDPSWWMVIMGEEFGETCQAVCEYRWGEALVKRDRMQRIDHAVAEATQVSAVGVAMIQSIMRDKWVDEITTAIPSDRRQVAKALGLGHENVRYDGEDIDPIDAEVWINGRLVNQAVTPHLCVHNVGLTPGLWCGACTNARAMQKVEASDD